jgi:hypothetical protein
MNDVIIRLMHKPGALAGDWFAGWEGDPVTYTYPDGHTCRISVVVAYANTPTEALSELGERLISAGILT